MRPRCNHISQSRKYATKWGHLYGASKEEDIWLGCVYMPDTSQSQEVYDKAIADLAADITHFATKPGHIVLAGDFNARVGHRSHTSVPAHLRDTAPAHGEGTVNQHGQQLLQFCADNDLAFLSGVRPGSTGPTCHGHGRRTASGETGTSILDHIIGSRALALSGASPPHCYTMTKDDYSAELQDIASDHVPVLLRCVNRAPKAPCHNSSQRRWVWRLERLRDQDTLELYGNKIQELTAASAWMQGSVPRNCVKGDQVASDRALEECMRIFTTAAQETIGMRCIRPGYTL
jgi:hypothetical protein